MSPEPLLQRNADRLVQSRQCFKSDRGREDEGKGYGEARGGPCTVCRAEETSSQAYSPGISAQYEKESPTEEKDEVGIGPPSGKKTGPEAAGKKDTYQAAGKVVSSVRPCGKKNQT